jgi:hypothetical protein
MPTRAGIEIPEIVCPFARLTVTRRGISDPLEMAYLGFLRPLYGICRTCQTIIVVHLFGWADYDFNSQGLWGQPDLV